MTIGNLYNAQNVVVGQAALLVAPAATPLPTFDKLNLADPLDNTGWNPVSLTIGASATGSLTVVVNGMSKTVAGLTTTSTTAQVVAAFNAATASLGVTWASASVGPVSAGVVLVPTGAEGPVLVTSQMTGGTVTIVNPSWQAVGATDQGWTYTANKSTNTITVEEQSSPVGMTISSQSVEIAGALSEDISSNLALAFNMTSAAVAPTLTIPGYDVLSGTDTVISYALALVTQHFNGFPRIIYAPTWTQLSNAAVAFRRAADKRQYAAAFATTCKPGQIQIFNITAPHN